MKRASKIITSRTMRGSGPTLSPDQEAMPRAGGPTQGQQQCVVAYTTAGP